MMSVMRQRNRDGTFLVFDLGGGTLDIAIAQSMKGRVSLLAHGGVRRPRHRSGTHGRGGEALAGRELRLG